MAPRCCRGRDPQTGRDLLHPAGKTPHQNCEELVPSTRLRGGTSRRTFIFQQEIFRSNRTLILRWTRNLQVAQVMKLVWKNRRKQHGRQDNPLTCCDKSEENPFARPKTRAKGGQPVRSAARRVAEGRQTGASTAKRSCHAQRNRRVRHPRQRETGSQCANPDPMPTGKIDDAPGQKRGDGTGGKFTLSPRFFA